MGGFSADLEPLDLVPKGCLFIWVKNRPKWGKSRGYSESKQDRFLSGKRSGSQLWTEESWRRQGLLYPNLCPASKGSPWS